MIGLNVLFFLFIALFGVIGLVRGWAKELLVTFSVVLALFVISVLQQYVPFIRDNLIPNAVGFFWFRTAILVALVFFGYQSPNIPRLAANNRFARDRLQDSLLGLFMGGINGYLIWGTEWFYLHDANYPFSFFVAAPEGPMADAITQLVAILPPTWLGSPMIYFAVAIAFAFVLVVFI